MSAAEFSDAEEAKRAIVEVGKRMYRQGYVVTNDGNVSVRMSDGSIIVTPTGVCKGYMSTDMMVRIDPNGKVLEEGTRRPSSETKMHLRVFKENPDVYAVVHAHPIYATTFAVAGIPLDEPLMTEATMQLGTVPLAHYAEPGTTDVPDSVAPYCHDHTAVLLSNHGALTWGSTLEQAFSLMEVVENYAKVTFNIRLLGVSRPLSQLQIDGIDAIRDRMGLPKIVMPCGAAVATNLTDVAGGPVR